MAREPREQLVVDLLTDKWTASNTFGLTPSIIYASQDEPSTPHITVEKYDQGPINGGATSYSFMDGSGGGPGQMISGTVTLHAFASDHQLSGATTSSADVFLNGSGQSGGTVNGGVTDEIRRIIKNNASQPTNPTTSNQPVDVIAPTDFTPGPTDEPDRAHYVGQVLYIYHN